MKQLKLVSLQLICLLLAGFTFASCIDDDDNDDDQITYLTGDQLMAAYASVSGSHSGKMIFNDASTSTTKLDTVSVRWDIINDSTMIIRNFPVAAVIDNIQDGNSAMVEALKTQADQSMVCTIKFYRLSPVLFHIAPNNLVYYVNYGGKEHKVEMAFYINNAYSFGMYNSKNTTTPTFQMSLLEGAVWVDRSATDTNPINYIKGSKQFILYK